MRVGSVLYDVKFLDGITAAQRSDSGFDSGFVRSWQRKMSRFESLLPHVQTCLTFGEMRLLILH
jgi:hypothetical protein